MSISGIYLLISIHTLYHSLVLSLSLVHEITYFYHTLHLFNIRPLCSADSHQLPTPAGPPLYIACPFTAGDMPAGNLSVASLPTSFGRVISWALVGGQAAPSVFELGHRRRALHLLQAAQSGPQCAGPTTFPSKYRSALDYSRTTSSDK